MTVTSLISTVGTSLFFPNLDKIDSEKEPELAKAYQAKQWAEVARLLDQRDPQERLCGAEINSVASMHQKGFVSDLANLFFCHSATEEGQAIGEVLRNYYQRRGCPRVECYEIEGLQDADPQRFRTEGLRNLARRICTLVRSYGSEQLAINATGGYKAQIAIAVMLGQALAVPVYYKHERFNEIISFPPMPIALDFEIWLTHSAMLFDLAESTEPIPNSAYPEAEQDQLESLCEQVPIDGETYLELSPTGLIFHETFRSRFTEQAAHLLPAEIPPERKRSARGEKSGHFPADALEWMQRVVEEVPYVVTCGSFYHNPDLPSRSGFRLGSDGIEGQYSNGTYTVKFRVESDARGPSQQQALVAYLNQWLRSQ